MSEFVNSYQFKIRLHRTIIDDRNHVWKLYPSMVALVIFPKIQPSEIIMLAREGEKLPSGLTRHLIHERALNLNYPLSELKSYDSLTE